MGSLAEAAIVNYRLSFADQGKQTSIFRFRLQQQKEVCCFCFPFSSNKRKFLFSVSSVFRLRNSGKMEMETWRMET
jgi:hypothetical protein